MTQPSASDDSLRLGISVTRVFAAPRDHVWREWTDPEAFADWFGGLDGVVPLSTVSMDVTPGGTWGLTMITARSVTRSTGGGSIERSSSPNVSCSRSPTGLRRISTS